MWGEMDVCMKIDPAGKANDSYFIYLNANTLLHAEYSGRFISFVRRHKYLKQLETEDAAGAR